MSAGWWPIECAPQDGTLIDLWVVHVGGEAGRKTECRWMDWGGGDWFTTDIMITPVALMGGGGWRPTHWRSIPGGPRTAPAIVSTHPAAAENWPGHIQSERQGND